MFDCVRGSLVNVFSVDLNYVQGEQEKSRREPKELIDFGLLKSWRLVKNASGKSTDNGLLWNRATLAFRASYWKDRVPLGVLR